MTNNHSIDEMSESNNLADNHVEREEDATVWDFPDEYEHDEENDFNLFEDFSEEPQPLSTADFEDFKNRLLTNILGEDEDDDWNECEEDDEPADRYDDCEFHRRSGMHDDWYDDFDDDGAGWDVYQGASANPYYNDQLDLDQQSDEFWECL